MHGEGKRRQNGTTTARGNDQRLATRIYLIRECPQSRKNAQTKTKHARNTCLAVKQEVPPVGIRLHETPVEQLVDGAA